MKSVWKFNKAILNILLSGFLSAFLCLNQTSFLWANPDSTTNAPAPTIPPPSQGLQIVEMTNHQTPLTEKQKYTIASCFKLALKESDVVAMKKEEIQKAIAQFLEAASYAVGDVDFVMTDFRQGKSNGVNNDGSVVVGAVTAPESRERTFLYQQPIFQGFKAIGALMGAGSLKKQRTQEWVRAEQLLLLDVVVAFYNILQAKHDAEITEEILKSYKDRIEELRERENIGRSRLSEVKTAEAGMKLVEAELEGYRGLQAVQEHVLEFLTGIIIKADQLVDSTIEKEMPRTVDDYLKLIGNRPDVKATEQAVKTAFQGVVVAQSDFWPQLSLEGNKYVHREGSTNGIDWDVLFKVDVPIFQGFGNAGKLKSAWSDWKQAKSAYRLTKRDASLEIKKAFEIWMTSHNRFRSLQEAVKASEENYRLEKLEYTRSLVNNLDVLQALRSLLESQRQANEAFYQSKVETWRLKVAVGETI